MKYSIGELIKYLSISNNKLKKLKKNIKNVRIERNKYRKQIEEINILLKDTTYYFGKYDFPSDQEHYELKGKLYLKDEVLNILKK